MHNRVCQAAMVLFLICHVLVHQQGGIFHLLLRSASALLDGFSANCEHTNGGRFLRDAMQVIRDELNCSLISITQPIGKAFKDSLAN